MIFSLAGIVLSVLIVTSVKLTTADNGGGYGGSGSWPALPAKSPLLEELRVKTQALQINPFWTSDRNLARLIVESGYRVDRAARKLRRTASFRAKIKADQLLEWTPAEHFTSNLPYECTGYANDGSPVFLFPFGGWDTRSFFKSSNSKQLYMYFLRMLEDSRSKTAGRYNPKSGDSVDQVVFIVDAKGYGLRQLLSLRHTLTFLRIAYAIDRHYPFLVQKWYVVNAPLAFQIFWRLVRTVATPTLERAVEIYNSYNKRGPNALAHNLPKDAIPVSLGGTYQIKYQLPGRPSLSAKVQAVAGSVKAVAGSVKAVAGSVTTQVKAVAGSVSTQAKAVVGSVSTKVKAAVGALTKVLSSLQPPPSAATSPASKPAATTCAKCNSNSAGYGPPPPPVPIVPFQYGPPSVPAIVSGGYGPPKATNNPTKISSPVSKLVSSGYSYSSYSPPSTQVRYGPPMMLYRPQQYKMVAPWEGYGGYA